MHETAEILRGKVEVQVREINVVKAVRQRRPDRECSSGSGERNPVTETCIRVNQEVLLGAYMGANERFESGHHDRNQRRFEQIIGNSPALESVLEEVERIAPTDSAVLIKGETGTGKELIARAIHIISERYERPFIKVNCAAIPFDLLESELFGHEKGALIDAITQQIGRFEMANKGTLFLNEVGDIPLALQPKLLRALQKQKFERLGSTRTPHVNVLLMQPPNPNSPTTLKHSNFLI